MCRHVLGILGVREETGKNSIPVCNKKVPILLTISEYFPSDIIFSCIFHREAGVGCLLELLWGRILSRGAKS